MRFLAVVGALAIAAVVASAIYFFGGFYSVAASNPSPGIVDWVLVRVRAATVARLGVEKPPVPLEDRMVVRQGAKAFAELGCVSCHGGPGADWQKFAEGLQPMPPDLNEVGKARTPGELFWVVKNGIKMTGMPGFTLIKAEDQKLWTVVAFIRALPTVTADDFKAWTAPPPPAEAPPPPQ